jgi:hypothetical protein
MLCIGGLGARVRLGLWLMLLSLILGMCEIWRGGGRRVGGGGVTNLKGGGRKRGQADEGGETQTWVRTKANSPTASKPGP